MEEKIRVLLVDDEYLALNLLENFVQKIPDLEIIDRLKSPLKALEIMNKQTIDLLFLDIQMPSLSGMNLLKTLRYPPVTIFTTAYKDYAIEAFDLNAVDYLLKPFSFERFVQAVNKAKEQLQLRHYSEIKPSKLEIEEKEKSFFSVKVDGKVVKIRFEDIQYIEGLKEYVRIVCSNGRFVTLESLKNLEELLPSPHFLRVHKSYIIAKEKVVALEGNMLEINGQKIPVSRSKRDEIIQLIF